MSTKPVFVDFETTVTAAFANTVATTVWDALGEATTPAEALAFLNAVPETDQGATPVVRVEGQWVPLGPDEKGPHNDLLSRDAADAHPVEAITGLSNTLGGLSDAIGALGSHAGLVNRDAADSHPMAAITGLSSALSAIEGDVAALQAIIVTVTDYGAVGDGVTDDTAAIQAAIDAVEAAGGGVVRFPDNDYKVSSTLVIDSNAGYLSLNGESMFGTRLVRTGDYGDTVHFQGVNVSARNNFNAIRNMRFQANGLMSSGAHLHLSRQAYFQLENVSIYNPFIGIYCESVGQSHFNNIAVYSGNIYGGSPTGRRFLVFKNSPAGAWAETGSGANFINGFELVNGGFTDATNAAEYGIYITSCDGLWFQNGHIGGASDSNICLEHETAATKVWSLCFFENVMSDSQPAGGIGLKLTGSNASYRFREIKFSNCTWAGGGVAERGIAVTAGCDVDTVQFANCSIYGYVRQGVTLYSTDARGIDFVNCVIKANSWNDSGSYDNVAIGAGVTGASFVGGRIGGGVDDGATSWSDYGISLNSAADRVRVIGVDLSGNLSGGINRSARADNVIVAQCIDTSDDCSVASATTIALPATCSLINVTGTTNIATISSTERGRVVYLKFAGALTLQDGTGNLSLAGNVTTSANDVLCLVCDGTTWHQVSALSGN